MHIHQTTNPAEEAGKKISEIIGSHKNPLLFLISGGSSLKVLDYIDEEVLGSHITIVALDERFSREPEVNNFLQIKQTAFYDSIIFADVNAIDTTPSENETIEELASRWDSAIKEWLQENPKGVIVATAGIGEDGHVAGMMPYPDEQDVFERMFMNNNQLVVGYDAEDKNPYNLRITSTMTLLKQVDHVVSFATGENKKPQILQAQEIDKPLYECPSRVLFQLPKGDLYTDIVV